MGLDTWPACTCTSTGPVDADAGAMTRSRDAVPPPSGASVCDPHRTTAPGAKAPPSISTICPPAVAPDTGARPLMNGGSSAASGSSSITIAGSLLLPSVPGGTGVAVDDPSPLTSGSSTAPPGGTGSMTGGGGSGVVGAGMLPLVDLPSSAAATLADVEKDATAPAFEPEVTNTSRAPLALMRAS